jgi:thioredoxin 1
LRKKAIEKKPLLGYNPNTGRKLVSKGIAITGGNFEQEVLQSPIPVLIDFWASWCGPCKMIGPVIDQLAGEYEGRIKIGKVNVDEESGLAQQHGIVSIPTLVLYKGGNIAAQRTGSASKRDIEAIFIGFIES